MVAVELVALGEDDCVGEDEHVALLHDAAAAVDEPHVELRLELAGRRRGEVLQLRVEPLGDAVQRGDALRLLLARALLLVQLVAQPLDVLQRLVDAVRSWEGRENGEW